MKQKKTREQEFVMVMLIVECYGYLSFFAYMLDKQVVQLKTLRVCLECNKMRERI